MTGSPFPALRLLVAMRNGPTADHTRFIVDAPGVAPTAGHWTDLSSYAREYKVDRGVQHELGQGEAGTITVSLSNVNGEFNPWMPNNAVTPGLFSPYLAAARDGGTINPAGALKLPVQLRVRWPLGPDPWNMLFPNQSYPTERVDQSSDYYGFNTTVTTVRSGVMAITALAAGSATVTAPERALSLNGTYGLPVTAGSVYVAMASFQALTASNATCAVQFNWFNAAGADIGGAVAGTAVTSVATAFTQATVTATAPAGAVYASLRLVFTAAAAGETHFATRMGVFRSATIPAWSTWFARLTGHIAKVIVEWPDNVSAWAKLEAVDAFRYFNDQQIGNQVLVQQSTGQRLAALLPPMGWPANVAQIDDGVQQCQANTQNLVTATVLGHMQDVEATEGGALFMNGLGLIRFISRFAIATSPPFSVPQCWFGDQISRTPDVWGSATWGSATWGTSDLPFEPGPALVLDDADIVTGCTCTRVGGTAQLFGSGVRTKSLSNLLHLTDIASAAHAAWVVDKLHIPVHRLASIHLSLIDFLGDDAGVLRVLGLGLMHRVSINRTQFGFIQVGLIEHISETITVDAWTISLSLSPTAAWPFSSWSGYQ